MIINFRALRICKFMFASGVEWIRCKGEVETAGGVKRKVTEHRHKGETDGILREPGEDFHEALASFPPSYAG